MTKYSLLFIAPFMLFAALSFRADKEAPHGGRIVDAVTGKPIEGALVTQGDTVVHSDRDGNFQLHGNGTTLGIRAYGYLRAEATLSPLPNGTPVLLTPFKPKALYLTSFGVASQKLRGSALALIKETELNALVIDLKSDTGMVAFRSASALAAEAGALKVVTIKDLNALVSDLHAKGIYLIARIDVFKDNRLALTRHDLAVKTAGGTVWADRDGMAWTDPFSKAVWDYNIGFAVEAARAGFDEIQFDYARFPDELGLAYSAANTEAKRIEAISGFLAEARSKLTPYNVFLAADIFGYVPWNKDDTRIGQTIESLAPVLDYISPMLYPSGFQFGIPGYQNPVQHPHEVVSLTLERARERSGLPPIRFRPWLQAFQDYAFDKRLFRDEQIRAQIDAAEAFGSDGWMLWNPRNVYTRAGLRPAEQPAGSGVPAAASEGMIKQ